MNGVQSPLLLLLPRKQMHIQTCIKLNKGREKQNQMNSTTKSRPKEIKPKNNGRHVGYVVCNHQMGWLFNIHTYTRLYVRTRSRSGALKREVNGQKHPLRSSPIFFPIRKGKWLKILPSPPKATHVASQILAGWSWSTRKQWTKMTGKLWYYPSLCTQSGKCEIFVKVLWCLFYQTR